MLGCRKDAIGFLERQSLLLFSPFLSSVGATIRRQLRWPTTETANDVRESDS